MRPATARSTHHGARLLDRGGTSPVGPRLPIRTLRNARGGGGLYPLELRGSELTLGPPEASIANASFGIWSRRLRLAYFVDEQEGGRVMAWKRTAEGWREVGASGSGGALPCFLALHPSGTHLAVANHADGSVALLRLDKATGSIRDLADIRRGRGASNSWDSRRRSMSVSAC